MNRIARAGVGIAAAVAFVAGTAGPVRAQKAAAGAGAVRAAIEAANKKFSDGAAKKDAAIIATAYTSDAEAFPPNSDVVKGRPALQKLWQSVLDSGIAAFELKTTEVESAGNI